MGRSAARAMGARGRRPALAAPAAWCVLLACVSAAARAAGAAGGLGGAAAVRQLGGAFLGEFKWGGLDPARWVSSGWWSNGQPFNSGWDPGYWAINFHTLELLLKRDRFQHQSWDLPYTSGEIRSTAQYGEGCYSVCMKMAPPSGVSSSFYLQNFGYDSSGRKTLNELDIEFVGKDHRAVQTNFFSRVYNDSANSGSGNEQSHALPFDATTTWAAYSFRWQKDRLDWWANDQHLRSQFAYEGGPALPNPETVSMQIAANIWAVNKQAEEWAGPLDPNFYDTRAKYQWIWHEPGRECKIRTQCGEIYGDQ